MWQHRWAIWSGVLGATASGLAKMAVTSPQDNSPIHGVVQWIVCGPLRLGKEDLDDRVFRWVYRIGGDLMIHYGINLMPYLQALRIRLEEDVVLKLNVFETDGCQILALGPRVLCFVGMLLMNAYMIAAFLRGMQESGSVVGTAITTAANFTTSALWGSLLWNERFPSAWWLGFSSVLAGVLLLSSVQPQTTDEPSPEAKAASVSSRGSGQSMYFNQNYSTTSGGSNTTPKEELPNSVSRKYMNAMAVATGKAPPASSSPQRKRGSDVPIPAKLCLPSPSSPFGPLEVPRGENRGVQKKKPVIKPNLQRIQQQKKSITTLVDRSFFNECPLCDEPLFDESTGTTKVAVADLSPTCYHLMHARCLKQSTSSPRSGSRRTIGASSSSSSECPICRKTIPMFMSAKQSAHFGGFWIDRVEACLRKLGPGAPNEKGEVQPQQASAVREYLRKDATLTEIQKGYIDDDPNGLGKGLTGALEWGGSIDYNSGLVKKGHRGWHICLRTKGLWRYSARFDDLWLWEWGEVHPRQRCEQCQMMKRPLPIACAGCTGSAEAAYYCSEGCQRRDKGRHKMTCELWQSQGPNGKQ